MLHNFRCLLKYVGYSSFLVETIRLHVYIIRYTFHPPFVLVRYSLQHYDLDLSRDRGLKLA